MYILVPDSLKMCIFRDIRKAFNDVASLLVKLEWWSADGCRSLVVRVLVAEVSDPGFNSQWLPAFFHLILLNFTFIWVTDWYGNKRWNSPYLSFPLVCVLHWLVLCYQILYECTILLLILHTLIVILKRPLWLGREISIIFTSQKFN